MKIYDFNIIIIINVNNRANYIIILLFYIGKIVVYNLTTTLIPNPHIKCSGS